MTDTSTDTPSPAGGGGRRSGGRAGRAAMRASHVIERVPFLTRTLAPFEVASDGQAIVLKGNLHTTDVMLYGSVQDVIDASKKAIDDAAEGGGFILSTGDQCGRDTPFENIMAMVETARTYGKY